MPKRVGITWHGGRILASERAGAAEGLRLAAEHILGESTKRVPHETGALQDSGVASVDESSLTAAVSYDTSYAVRQHEELEWQHDAGRTAKYLEGPLDEESDTVGDIIATSIRGELS